MGGSDNKSHAYIRTVITVFVNPTQKPETDFEITQHLLVS